MELVDRVVRRVGWRFEIAGWFIFCWNRKGLEVVEGVFIGMFNSIFEK